MGVIAAPTGAFWLTPLEGQLLEIGVGGAFREDALVEAMFLEQIELREGQQLPILLFSTFNDHR